MHQNGAIKLIKCSVRSLTIGKLVPRFTAAVDDYFPVCVNTGECRPVNNVQCIRDGGVANVMRDLSATLGMPPHRRRCHETCIY